MANQATVKLYESQSGQSINLPNEFVKDSAFPFKVKEELVARIENGKIIAKKSE